MGIGDDVGLHALLDAVVSVNSDLDLPSVLEKIVASACTLSGARYGALGVLAPGTRRLSEFVTYGITSEQRAGIGDLPVGQGVLGVLIDDPRPLRLRRLSDHPRSVGFPPGHPPMHGFLGVPIWVAGTVFGNLYLTDKAQNAEFTTEDESLVVALAAAAGTAVEKAALYGASRQRERWLAAETEITTAFLASKPRSQALRMLAARAREVADMDLAAIMLGRSEQLTVEVVEQSTEGADPVAFERGWGVGDEVEVSGPLASALAGGPARLVPSATWGAEVGLGDAIVAPLRSTAGVVGVLVLGRWDGVDPVRVMSGDQEVALAARFAEQTAVALELARGQSDRARLAVYEDRDRIARDLHDLVVQRLFAVGLSLRTMTNKTLPEQEQVRRVSQAVDDLDATVKELRRSIFQLHQRPGEGNLRADLEAILVAARNSLGFLPDLEVSGGVDQISEEVAPQLAAVTREALSNAARHASATSVRVSLTVEDDIALEIEDDGIGLQPGGHRGGLTTMTRRAEALGGSCTIESVPSGGARVTWRVPLV
jgi:signal transduction histidine kinase